MPGRISLDVDILAAWQLPRVHSKFTTLHDSHCQGSIACNRNEKLSTRQLVLQIVLFMYKSMIHNSGSSKALLHEILLPHHAHVMLQDAYEEDSLCRRETFNLESSGGSLIWWSISDCKHDPSLRHSRLKSCRATLKAHISRTTSSHTTLVDNGGTAM